MMPTLPSTSLGDYLTDSGLYAATLSMASAHIAAPHRPTALSRSHSTYEFVQPNMLQAPRIGFDWLHGLNFTNYVWGYNYLGVEDHTAIRRFYRSLEKRRSSMARHHMYEMAGQVDTFYDEVAGAQRRSSAISSQWEYQPSGSGAMPSDPLAHEDKRGARWQSLVESLSPEILLIDPMASNSFLSTLEHGTDEDFEMAKAQFCCPGSPTWETCLKLTGVHKMIEDLEEGKSNLSLEVRKWIAGEIKRRVTDAVPTVYAGSSRGSVHSLHSDVALPLE